MAALPPIPEKTCRKCGVGKPATEFYKQPVNRDGLQSYCKACMADDARKYHQSSRSLAHRWNIPVEDLVTMRLGTCAICGEVGTETRPLHVDHDHACCSSSTRCCGKCIRGGLCDRCNRGLGFFRDSPELLGNAARYLQNWEARAGAA